MQNHTPEDLNKVDLPTLGKPISATRPSPLFATSKPTQIFKNFSD